MRYIKALIKTINQMEKTYKYISLGFSSLIFGIILMTPCEIFQSHILLYLPMLFVFCGWGFIFKALWEEELKDDLRKFINKIKSNLD